MEWETVEIIDIIFWITGQCTQCEKTSHTKKTNGTVFCWSCERIHYPPGAVVRYTDIHQPFSHQSKQTAIIEIPK